MIIIRVKYKGWLITYDNIDDLWSLYTPDELEQPIGFRQAEAELSTLEQAKTFINHYNDY